MIMGKKRRIPIVTQETCPKCGHKTPSARQGFYVCDDCKRPPETQNRPKGSQEGRETGPNLNPGAKLLTTVPMAMVKD